MGRIGPKDSCCISCQAWCRSVDQRGLEEAAPAVHLRPLAPHHHARALASRVLDELLQLRRVVAAARWGRGSSCRPSDRRARTPRTSGSHASTKRGVDASGARRRARPRSSSARRCTSRRRRRSPPSCRSRSPPRRTPDRCRRARARRGGSARPPPAPMRGRRSTEPVKTTWFDARVADHALARAGDRSAAPAPGSSGAPASREGAREVLATQRRARRVLHDHRVAREHRRHHHVHRREQRVVPRRQVEHDAQRLLHDAPLEARLGRQHDVRERRVGDGDHVAGAPGHARELALAPGPAACPSSA